MVDTHTVKVFHSDTFQTIKIRIAANLNSLPKYINFELNNEQLADAKLSGILKVDVLNVLDIFKIPFESDIENPFEQFYNFPGIKTLILKNNLNVVRDIALPFVYFHFELTPDTNVAVFRGLLQQIEKEIKKVLQKPLFNINSITYKNDYKAFFDRLREEIKDNREQNDAFMETLQLMTALPGLEFTSFKAKEITYVFNTNVNYLSLLSIFDKIELNDLFVFATINEYFKIYKHWSNKEKIEELQKDKKNDVIILYLSDNEVVKLFLEKHILNIEFTLFSFSQMKNLLVDRVLKLFSKSITNFQITNETQSSVKGVFLFPNFKLEPLILSHLILNDPLFSEQLYTDESEKAQGAKEFGGTTVLFEAATETITFVLTGRKAGKYDVFLRGEKMEKFPFNSEYLSVTISKCNSLSSVSQLQNFLSKRLSYYNEVKDDVIKLYRPFLPDFPKRSELRKRKLNKTAEEDKEDNDTDEGEMFMRKVYPELFTNKYLRKCDNSVELVAPERLKDYGKDNVILFPNSEKEGKQMYFGCRPNSKFPFIGLAGNDPKSQFRVVPCCYNVNQRNFPNSLLNRYLRGEKIEYECSGESKIKPRDFLTTKKSAGYERYGLLKPFTQFYALFNQPQFHQDYHFIRKGVDRSAFSFFQCIFEALKLPYKIKENNCESRLNFLRHIIENQILENPILNVGRQAFYNENIKTIKEQLVNRQDYLKPSLFVDIFEAYFNIKIFVFSNTSLLIPQHAQNYILDAECVNRNAVFILENEAEGDLPFPQCELIIFASKSNNDVYTSSFSPSDHIVQSTFQIFFNMCKSATFEKETIFYNFDPFLRNKELVKGQVINCYGKTSMFVIEFEGHEILLYTDSPSCPIDVEEKEFLKPVVDFEFALKFCTTYFSKDNLAILHDFSDNIHSIRLNLKNTYIIPVAFTPKVGHLDIRVVKSNFILPNCFQGSLLQKYLANKNITHYLSEYFKYLLSVYAKQNNLLTITTKDIINFVNFKPYFGKKSYQYDLLPSKFNVVNEGFVKDGKVIINSNELLKRLVYDLRLNKAHIMHYANLQEIPVQYHDVLDFHTTKSEILIKTFQRVVSFLEEEKSVHTLPL